MSSRARGRASSTILVRGLGRGASPQRGRAREVSPEPQIDGKEDQVPPAPIVTTLLHDTCHSFRFQGILWMIVR